MSLPTFCKSKPSTIFISIPLTNDNEMLRTSKKLKKLYSKARILSYVNGHSKGRTYESSSFQTLKLKQENLTNECGNKMFWKRKIPPSTTPPLLNLLIYHLPTHYCLPISF